MRPNPFERGRLCRALLAVIASCTVGASAATAQRSAFVSDPAGAQALHRSAVVPHDASALDALTAEEVVLASPVLAQVRIEDVSTSSVRRYAVSVRAVAYDLSGRTRRAHLTVVDATPFVLTPGRLPVMSLFAPSGSNDLATQPSLAAIGFVDGEALVFRNARGAEERYPLSGHSLFACVARSHPATCRAARLRTYGVTTPGRLAAFSDLAVHDPLATMLWMLVRKHDRAALFPSKTCVLSPRGDCASSAAFRRRTGFHPSQ